MLVGDALQALAFESLAAAAGLGASPSAVVAMLAELGRGAGSLAGQWLFDPYDVTITTATFLAMRVWAGTCTPNR